MQLLQANTPTNTRHLGERKNITDAIAQLYTIKCEYGWFCTMCDQYEGGCICECAKQQSTLNRKILIVIVRLITAGMSYQHITHRITRDIKVRGKVQ